MPELPEAEYMVRRLAQYAGDAVIIRTRILRRGYPAPRRVAGRVASYGRRAKNVLLHLDTGHTLRVQLGMTGHIYWIENAKHPPQFTRVLFELAGGSAIAFEDSRVFGSIEIHPTTRLDEVFADYGPEPLDPAFHWQHLRGRAARLSLPIKQFLLDQSRLAGLGNIWAAESLFGAKIHPEQSVSGLSDDDWRRLHSAIRRALTRAIANTFKVTEHPEDFPGADLVWLNVYGREEKPCRRCRAPIVRTVQAGRATYFCPRCQPL